MTSFIAALPMYDWPERRAGVDAQWAGMGDRLRAAGIDAPVTLVRRNADLPAVPGGIRDASGELIAADPATLPQEGLDLHVLWRHPALLLAQTCWGPMRETGLSDHVVVMGQQDYSGIAGGEGAAYSSAIVMRRDEGHPSVSPSNMAFIPVDVLRRRRFAFNEHHSMSGRLALKADLEAAGEGLHVFSDVVETGGHRFSIRAVAERHADVATIDCLSWAMAIRHEPAARMLNVVGWTGRRPGLPFVMAGKLSHLAGKVSAALAGVPGVLPR